MSSWRRTPQHARSRKEASRSDEHATRPATPLERCGGQATTSPNKAGMPGMSVLVSIAGLAFLILIHEAGHFFTARAVGMKPRRFYIGFPPAVLKTTRNGIEYGLGAIPLGGYVKIPGMHRPAPSDVDVHFGPALYESPRLLPEVERVKRGIAQGDFEGARAALQELERAIEQAPLSANAKRSAARGLDDL